MSPSRVSNQMADDQSRVVDLAIRGIGVEYPPFQLKPESLDMLVDRFYEKSPALSKVQAINRYTGIESRSAIGDHDHPIANGKTAPSISELCDLFLTEGVALSVKACRKAIKEWGGSVDEITHVVSTTCTNTANPGFDHFVVKELGLRSGVEKVLLHGVGCSGGLAALRTAANVALGASFRDRPARVLVLACEISSVLVRHELDMISEEQKVAIGVTLFSDCASAVVLSNGIGKERGGPIYELMGWDHVTLPDTEGDLGFDVDPKGWKVVLSPRVPELAAGAVPDVFEKLVRSIRPLGMGDVPSAEDFDWALHPGGLTIITGVQETMNIEPDLLRASYDVYVKHGNSSSATIFSVMDRLRRMGRGKEHVVGCAFGPGISVEMMLMKRTMPVEDPLAEDMPSEELD
ncbi:MAG: hypothetical protein M1832_004819 [Thelocarpon impressellum]|nr:MAG: hypothetical protein M1832_004819 [Thelocarpon impressellum]